MTWFHVISGFTLIALGIVMLIWMLTQRGFHYYFARLTLDFRGMAADLKTLIALRLPDAHAGEWRHSFRDWVFWHCWAWLCVAGSGLC